MTAIRPLKALLRAATSLGLLVALVAVPPILLITTIGWPLPTSVPDLQAAEQAARTGIGNDVIVNTLAVIAWLAWAQLAIAIVAETIATARGRPARILPVLPGLQTAVARLLASVALLATTPNPAAAAAESPPPAITLVAEPPATIDPAPHPTIAAALPAEPEAAPTIQPGAEPPAPAQTVTVERHDSYWAIAERTLGDGLRWREIRDLNTGRTMADGHTIAPHNDLLRPGWTLHLPAGALPPESPPDTDTIEVEVEVEVEVGDNLWTIAEDHLTDHLDRSPTEDEVRPHWQDLVATNRHHFLHDDNPDLIHPGQTITLPTPPGTAPDTTVPAPAPVTETDEAPPDLPATGPAPEPDDAANPPRAPSSTPPAPQPPVDDEVGGEAEVERISEAGGDTDGDGSSIGPVAVAMGGLASVALAVGAKRAIARHRRRLTAAHPGKIPRATRDSERPVHRQIVANADEDTIDDLRSVIGRLAHDLAEADTAARPRIVQHGPDHLDVLLGHACTDPPPGWSDTAGGAVWTYDPAVARDPSDTCAAPLLVTLGQPDDGTQLYLDLEADGLISLVGHPDHARGLARSIITELALSPLTETVRVLVIGDLVEATASKLDHVTVVGSWADAEDDIAAWARQSHQALTAEDWPNAYVGRGVDPDHDALAPLAVIASTPPPATLTDTLAEHRPAAVAVVVADRVDAQARVIDCQPGELTITDLGLTCTPQRLDEDTLAAMIRLLDTADEPDEPGDHVHEDTGPDLRGPEQLDREQPQLFSLVAGTDHDGLPPDAESSDEVVEPDYQVLVRLLGDIHIEGGKPLPPKPTAVIAYITLHHSVTVEALEDACWADPASGTLRKRLKDVMSECRAAIGSHHLPASTDGRYRRGPGIITDTELFDLRIARAANQPLAQQAETYRCALALVTGKVFTYPSRAGGSFTWIDTENLLSQWELKIQNVAQHCAETYLTLDAPDCAVEVARRALNALPLNAELTEALMCAHGTAGDLDAVDTVYRAHVDGLARIHNADPDPSTRRVHSDLRSTGEPMEDDASRG